ncbi:unnamed protein product [Notodromas monacha]|uniref:Uncharacterized protein n=1 Tax=Notodromas monacha TaxID=399045 RepID=A0A7R9GDE8_9CRUS|nr:unnamed protein product [Notodromas monacha]CAG0917102.1 unnamed protein product [Notodromas monacha]
MNAFVFMTLTSLLVVTLFINDSVDSLNTTAAESDGVIAGQHQRPLVKAAFGRILTADDKDSSFMVGMTAMFQDGTDGVADPGCLISER